jgi:hypothetical protein
MCLILLGKVAEDEANRCHASTSSASSTTCVETHRPRSLMTCAAAPPPSSPARSSGRHQRAEAAEGVDRAAVPRAATLKAVMSSRAAKEAGHA